MRGGIRFVFSLDFSIKPYVTPPTITSIKKNRTVYLVVCAARRLPLYTTQSIQTSLELSSHTRAGAQGTMDDSDDIYSDVDSDGFLQDMRSYGVAQALPLDVRTS
jgi:hypothetical protein